MNNILPGENFTYIEETSVLARRPTQLCPVCNDIFGALPGSRDAVCKNCGFKDPCCE